MKTKSSRQKREYRQLYDRNIKLYRNQQTSIFRFKTGHLKSHFTCSPNGFHRHTVVAVVHQCRPTSHFHRMVFRASNQGWLHPHIYTEWASNQGRPHPHIFTEWASNQDRPQSTSSPNGSHRLKPKQIQQDIPQKCPDFCSWKIEIWPTEIALQNKVWEPLKVPLKTYSDMKA